MQKPSMLIINKMDTEEAVQKYEEINDRLKNISGNLFKLGSKYKNYIDFIRTLIIAGIRRYFDGIS